MNLRLAATIARREMRAGVRGFRIFLACLALGIAAIAAVATVRESIEAGLKARGAVLLGGDAEIELTYHFASAQERAWMEKVAQRVSEIADFRSMAVTGDGGRALTQVKAVDAAYPLFGAVRLVPAMALGDALDGADGRPGAVMDPVLAQRLRLVPGDRFRLGGREFVLSAMLTDEPDGAGSGFSLGPRTIVRRSALEGSGLLQPGSLFDAKYRLKLPAGADPDAVHSAARLAIAGGGFRWRDSRNAAPGVSDFVEHLSAFLTLVGLAGLAVGGVGVSAAVRSYLDGKVAVIATLKTLGAEGRLIFQVYLMQIGAMAALGVALGLVLGAGVPLLLAPLLEARLPVPARFGLYPGALSRAAVYGVLVALLFTVWPLARTENIRAAALFRNAQIGLSGRPRAAFILVTVALLALLVAAAAAFSGEVRLSLWSAAALIATFFVLVALTAAIRALARALSRRVPFRRGTALRLALGAVGGPGGEARAIVLSLGIGLSVLATIGQIDSNLRRSIARELPDIAPLFFVVDIQPDQKRAFRQMLAGIDGVERVQIAPMLRGFITRINGRPAREVVGDHWVISGDRGITYSARLPARSRLTAGRWWPEDYSGPPQISFAAAEAGEMGLKLGDTITVNVLGRDITGEITSFRDVDFSSAGMGFVLSMNPAALAGAPHSNISTIYGDPAHEAEILRRITERFPNMTAISVRQAIERVAQILRAIAAAITYGALATIATGAVVLIGAAAAGEGARAHEAAILKTLGATRALVLRSFLARSAILGGAAGLVAIGAGGIAGWAVIARLMERRFVFDPGSAVLIVTGGIALSLIAGAWFSLRALNRRPSGILRAGD